MQARGSVLIARPVEEVFAFISDTGNDRLWRSHLVSTRGRADAVGDRIVQTYSAEGKSKTVELTVAEIDPPRRLTYALAEPVRARLSFQCRPDGAGTRVSAAFSATLSGPVALLAGRMQSELDKLIMRDLWALREHLESR